MKKIPVGIIGVGGYTGLELLKILLSHPYFELAYLGNSAGGVRADELYPALRGLLDMQVLASDPKEVARRCELVFLALPHKSAMEFAKELLSLGVKVVDLSADYRLDLQNYEANYCPHTDIDNLSHAIYGLPEYQKEDIAKASLVANPGCYPTATLLALLPFVKYIEGSVFVDAKSGVSGAGKNPSEKTHYCKINENMFAYSPLEHRHQIEIEEKVSNFGGKDLQVNFIPHLCPFSRGMLVSVYARASGEFDPLEVLRGAYRDSVFVRVVGSSSEVKNVAGTNFCDLFAKRRGDDLFISSAIDNLLRGASSQAIVNANLMFSLPLECGIPRIAYVP
ncbi:N-acetyl-gamma-glutamyl-phosphate reductase [uncultured Helicobacter sp.]|uniref:N-acetyl-gamma-glutamyl-phosphate reductase n=1 Tax=uncultured Helicobacter sp. TaxID=175537 RepID=UPI002637A721|nr:N-acetyl-gamma-glutamyl-phosphate reductase [uncultured Helicobacter sp.]